MSSATTIALVAVAVASAASATVSNMNAIKARQAGDRQNAAMIDQQEKNRLSAEAAANQSKAATTTNAGDVSMKSEEELEDETIRSKSTKNRLRVDNTGLSLGGSTTGTPKSVTGLSI